MENVVRKHPAILPPEDQVRRSIGHLLDECRRIRSDKGAGPRLAQFADTIRLLAAGLTPADREGVLRELSEVESRPARGGEAFGRILAFVRKDPRPNWSMADFQTALSEIADPKSVYNAVAYLASTGRLKRVSRGRYTIADVGAGIEYDGKDDGTSRASEHD